MIVKQKKRQQKRRYVHLYHHHFSPNPLCSLSLSRQLSLSLSLSHIHTFHAFAINTPSSPPTTLFLLHCFFPSSFKHCCSTHISSCKLPIKVTPLLVSLYRCLFLFWASMLLLKIQSLKGSWKFMLFFLNLVIHGSFELFLEIGFD